MNATTPRKTVKAKLSLVGPLLALLTVVLVPFGARAQSSAVTASSTATLSPTGQDAGQLFVIGHLRGDPEAVLDAAVFDRLRSFLLSLPTVRAAMKAEGVRDIEVQSADSVNILIDWMNQEQVDLAFVPAVAFTRQEGAYDAAFQLRRPGRDIVSPAGDRVAHRGVVFVNNRSPLFNAPAREPDLTEYLRRELPRYLASHPVAFVSSYSAVGYFYPYLRMADLTSNTQPQSYFFCNSSEEVVKSVINGVADIGACDPEVIEEVLANAPEGLLAHKDKLIRVILNTDVIPTDPVAIRSHWRPGGGPGGRPSPLGREIRNGLRDFFARHPELPRLADSRNDRYQELKESLERFQELGRERESNLAGPPLPETSLPDVSPRP